MENSVHFGKIYIVEWLPPDEKKRTGEMLFDHLNATQSSLRVPLAFKRVLNRDEFIGHIELITADFRKTALLPLLHIEAHGLMDAEGRSIGLCSDARDFLLWSDLMSVLIPLNQLTGLRLCVIVAACEGLFGMKMAQIVERAAFLALLGPDRSIYPSALVRALRIFYSTVLTTKNGRAAIEAMNDSISEQNVQFRIGHAEQLFKAVYRSFFARQCTPEEIDRRVEAIAASGSEQFRELTGFEMAPEVTAAAKEAARGLLTAHEETFNVFRRRFFFIDLAPDNERRFPVTYEECRDAS